MPHKNKLKVCLVAISLGKGGAERATALLSKMLHQQGYDVHLVLLNNVIDYEHEATLCNLAENKSKSVLNRLMRFKRLRHYLKKEEFDWIIDTRSRSSAFKEWMYLRYFYRGFKLIYVVHSAKLSQYFPKYQTVAKQMVKQVTHFIGVSQYITSEINGRFKTKKALTIHNPVVVPKISKSNSREAYILYVGRLENSVKNFDLMFNAFKQSELIEKNFHLKLVGDGPDYQQLIRKTEELEISDWVDFIPFTPTVFSYYQNAYFTILTSRYEGFPNVLIESLAMGTPVVAVNCISGPSEIIIHEKNGLLIENHRSDQLALAMNRMISDKNLYNTCVENSRGSIAHLNTAAIGALWKQILC